MKNTRLATSTDFTYLLDLAKEVEPLFGPMVEDPGFCKGLKDAIRDKCVFCVSEIREKKGVVFHGGIVLSRRENEILWLVVTKGSRGSGIGAALLSEAIGHLAENRPILVTTFDQTVVAGLQARRLYHRFGFGDYRTAGLNPAGIPTVTMMLVKQNNDCRKLLQCP